MAENQRPSGLAIASLVTGILSILSPFAGFALGIAGIVCGAIDMSRIKKGLSSEKGKGLDIAGIITGAVGIVVQIVIIIVIIVASFKYFT